MAAGRRCEAFEPRLVAGVEDPTPSPLLSSSQARTVGTTLKLWGPETCHRKRARGRRVAPRKSSGTLSKPKKQR